MQDIKLDEIKRMLEAADEAQLQALKRSLKGDNRKGVLRAIEKAEQRHQMLRAEQERVGALYSFQKALSEENGGGVIVGLDEVGRGPLAGPLVIGAVVLPEEPEILWLNDSKQVREDRREQVAGEIKSVALSHHVVFIEPCEIDALGMSKSLKKAFALAVELVEKEGFEIGTILLDGNPMRIDSREVNVVKGDAKCASIAAASIIAKVERDSLMTRYAEEYPQYGFAKNKGYGTKEHRDAISTYGLTDIHRRSFCSEFLQESLF